LKYSGSARNVMFERTRPAIPFGTRTFYFGYNPVMLSLITIVLFVFLLNIPFGYFRSRSKKYSIKWFLFIHIPVPLVIIARVVSHTDYKLIPVLVLFAVAGQVCGGRIGTA